MTEPRPLLSVHGLSVAFGGLTAVGDVSFAVWPGEIVALIGPNGAGKTTLFNLITRVLEPTAGDIRWQGRSLLGLQPHQLAWLGLTRTFQNLQIFGNMTVLENLMVGRHCRTRTGLLAAVLGLGAARRENQAVYADAWGRLQEFGLAELAHTPAADLSFGQQRLLEIARAMALEPRLLLLDEPMAGLQVGERRQIVELIRRLRDQGTTFLFVEHDMDTVMGVADRIVVLDYGRKIAEGTPAEIRHDPRVIAAYLGEDEEEAV